MTLQLFLNDLSFPQENCAEAIAIAHLKDFVGSVRAAARAGPVVLNADAPLSELCIGPNWPLAALRNSPRCLEESIYLKRVQDRAPYAQTVADLGGPHEEIWEYRLTRTAAVMAGELATSLGLAHAYTGLALSVATHDAWISREIEIDRIRLDADGELEQTSVWARNAAAADTAARHVGELISARRVDVADGRQLWVERGILFPHLHFIPRTRDQLQQLQAGDPVLESVVERLTGLNAAVGGWRTSGRAHPTFPFNVRPESRTRVALTDFNDDDGVSRRFSDHAEYSPADGRIHFLLQTEPVRRALIGHVGRKLGIG